jgi:hypothetical protein
MSLLLTVATLTWKDPRKRLLQAILPLLLSLLLCQPRHLPQSLRTSSSRKMTIRPLYRQLDLKTVQILYPLAPRKSYQMNRIPCPEGSRLLR